MRFGAWSPDQPDYGHEGLVTARNVYASPGGYRPWAAFSAATAALPAAWVGGGAYEYGGTTAMLGATAAALYSHAAGVWTSEFAVVTANPWFSVQFGDRVIWTHGGAPVKFTLSTGVGAALGGSPPSASYCAVAKGFVGLASSASSTFSWSGLEDAEGWTQGTNQCDEQIIPDGGRITGLAGGEFFVVFQRAAISIFEYVGVPFVFTNRKISDETGCITHGSIARAGDRYFFLSEQGFKMLRGGEITSIGVPDPETGQGGVDRTFLSAYSTSELEAGLRAAVDQVRKLIIWSMPGRLWQYHWPSGRWTDLTDSALVGVSYGMTASATLEGIAVTFPSLEDVTPSLDDAYWRGGDRLLLFAKTDFKLYTSSSGANLETTLKTAKLEPFKGQTCHVRTIRVDSDATTVTLNLDCYATLYGSATRTTSADQRANGDISVRGSGRYVQPEFIREAGAAWTCTQGFDLEAQPGGRL